MKSIEEIQNQIDKLETEKDNLEKELQEKATLKRNMEKETTDLKKLELFKGKEEKDFVLIDSANVMAMGKIQNYEDKEKPLHLLFDFERDNTKIKVFLEIGNSEDKIESFVVWKGEEKWGKYSKKYYEDALRVAKEWKSKKLEFYVTDKKDSPILMSCDDLGFVLAPRVKIK